MSIQEPLSSRSPTAVDNNLAPVVSMSANIGCEAANTSANLIFYQGLAQQANTQGITWVISGSDAGPASCDANGAALAISGLGVRFPASVPEVTAVGGLEFDEQGGNYWSATNTNGASALSYIPEMVWNDAIALNALWAGGGGTSIYFPKPAWQAGPGVPNDGVRDVPDVAMAASIHHDGYQVINGGVTNTNGGSSAAAPVFAGVVSLINQYLVSHGIQSKPGLGNINPNLYRLAASGAGVFHDITLGSNIVPCGIGTLDCPNGTMGFSAGPGYDLASGLGSVDVAKLVNLWTSQPATGSAIVVSANPNPVGIRVGSRFPGQSVEDHHHSPGRKPGIGTTLTELHPSTDLAPPCLHLRSSIDHCTLGSVTATVAFAKMTVLFGSGLRIHRQGFIRPGMVAADLGSIRWNRHHAGGRWHSQLPLRTPRCLPPACSYTSPEPTSVPSPRSPVRFRF